MIIIAGYTLTSHNKRDAAVKAHAEMVGRARAYDGCIDISISADAVDPERINILEIWRDQRALDDWRGIADPPQVERRETYVSLYRAPKAEAPF